MSRPRGRPAKNACPDCHLRMEAGVAHECWSAGVLLTSAQDILRLSHNNRPEVYQRLVDQLLAEGFVYSLTTHEFVLPETRQRGRIAWTPEGTRAWLHAPMSEGGGTLRELVLS